MVRRGQNPAPSGRYSPAARRFLSQEIRHLIRERGYEPSRAVAAALSMARRAGMRVPARNPLTRKETADLLRDARDDYRLSGAFSPGTFERPYYQGRGAGQQRAAFVFGRATRFPPPPNPSSPRRRHPGLVTVGVLPAQDIEVRYRRTGRDAGPYVHDFRQTVRVYALADGSLLWKGKRPLWKWA